MPTFGRVAPTIYVQDIHRALEFYRDAFGFEVQFTNGEPVLFAVIAQGSAELHLIVEPKNAGSCHAHIMVDDVDKLHDQLQRANATIRQAPKVQEWGLKDIIATDPDGNVFEFASPIEANSST